MKLGEYQRTLIRRLTESGVESPGLCSRLIIEKATGIGRDDFIFALDREISASETKRIEQLTARRRAGEPMAYILGEREFYNASFIVSQSVLIPRPETEALVELALRAGKGEDLVFADIGCGSGCVGLSIALERPTWRGVLIDNSASALAVARENRARLGASANFILGNLFALPFGASSLDLVVSNPPYIAENERGEVCAETLAYEPVSALFSSQEGLAHIRGLVSQASVVLRDGGSLILEHGFRQQDSVIKILEDSSFSEIRGHRDLAGLPRCVTARKTGGCRKWRS